MKHGVQGIGDTELGMKIDDTNMAFYPFTRSVCWNWGWSCWPGVLLQAEV
jgi:hypothetical protein